MSKKIDRSKYMVLFPKPGNEPPYHSPGDTCTSIRLRFVCEEEDGNIININDWRDKAFSDACINVFVSRSSGGPHFAVEFHWGDVWSLRSDRIKAIAAFDALVSRRLRKMEDEAGSPNGPVDRFNRILKAIGVERCARYVQHNSSSYAGCVFRFGDRDAACQMFSDLLEQLYSFCAEPSKS